MPDIPVLPSKKLDINQKPETLSHVVDVLNNAASQLAFFAQTLSTRNAGTNDVSTHMELLKSSIKSIKNELELDYTQQSEDDLLTQVIRQQSKQIRDFSTQIGNVLTAEQFSQAIKYYEDKFEKWYETIGFQYASLSIKRHCLQADFTPEMCPEDAPNFPQELKLTDEPYHHELIDCDHNRAVIKDLFKNAFPGVRIREFMSRITDDRVNYGLRISVLIPYEDLQNI